MIKIGDYIVRNYIRGTNWGRVIFIDKKEMHYVVLKTTEPLFFNKGEVFKTHRKNDTNQITTRIITKEEMLMELL